MPVTQYVQISKQEIWMLHYYGSQNIESPAILHIQKIYTNFAKNNTGLRHNQRESCGSCTKWKNSNF